MSCSVWGVEMVEAVPLATSEEYCPRPEALLEALRLNGVTLSALSRDAEFAVAFGVAVESEETADSTAVSATVLSAVSLDAGDWLLAESVENMS